LVAALVQVTVNYLQEFGVNVGVLDSVQEVQLRAKLRMLEQEHRELDAQIAHWEQQGTNDQLHLRRLKKMKLALKDQIIMIEAQIIPDIIA
jgi:hypothetical protein